MEERNNKLDSSGKTQTSAKFMKMMICSGFLESESQKLLVPRETEEFHGAFGLQLYLNGSAEPGRPHKIESA